MLPNDHPLAQTLGRGHTRTYAGGHLGAPTATPGWTAVATLRDDVPLGMEDPGSPQALRAIATTPIAQVPVPIDGQASRSAPWPPPAPARFS